MTLRRALTHGLWRDLPPFRLVLGLCPALAVTATVRSAVGMGAAVTFVLVFSNLLIALLRRAIPDRVRIAAFIVVIATLVVIVELVMKAWFFGLGESLGIYVPLIVVNCLPLGRAEAFASRNPVLPSLADGLSVGVGYALSLAVMASIREVLGAGTWYGHRVLGAGFEPFAFMAQAPGAFLCLGLLLGAMNAWSRRRGEIFIQT